MNRSSKTILITGAGSGIGRATAFALVQKGHRVIATTETEDQAKDLSIELPKAEVFKLNICDENDRKKIDQYSIHVLINNAAIGESGSLAEISMDKVRHNFEVNVFSTLALSQRVIADFVEKDRGTVIFISSLAGRLSMPFLAPYSMTKFALSSGAEALRSELKKISKNIHVSIIEPGAYHTGFNQLNVGKKLKWVSQDSAFAQTYESIYQKELLQFKWLETDDLSAIVRKIVKASEAKRPKLRYTAPWWQALGVRVLRIFGK